MGIFDFLKPKENSKTEHLNNQISNFNIEKIDDLFRINIRKEPDFTFTKGLDEKNTAGEMVKNYRKTLAPMEFDIFDTLEIKIIDNDSGRNLNFTNYNFDLNNISNLRKVVDSIFLLYGVDDSLKGKYNDNDTLSFKDDYWSGRSWCEDKFDEPISIDYDIETGLNLTIWTNTTNKN